jgi:adenylylsulfate kinase
VGRDNPNAFAVWLTGLPASGKSTVAVELAKQLRERGIQVAILESDVLRKLFSAEPRYDEQNREYFYTSLAFIGRVLTEHGISVIFDATANRKAYRDRARQQIPCFIEVFVACPIEICMQRDPKGIYRKARSGEASHVPGLQAPYEPPASPEVVIDGHHDHPADAANRILATLAAKGFLTTPAHF